MFAVLSGPSRSTDASVTVDTIHAGGAVLTSVAQMTVVDVYLTINTGESRGTVARVRGDQIVASAAILTWIVQTLVDVNLASRTLKSV